MSLKRLYQRIIYEFFRAYFRLVVPLFFRVEKEGSRGYFERKMPTVVTSNHPNTLLDPILTGLNFWGQLRFLANTGLFQHPVSRWFFLWHFCIPVKRHNDPPLEGFDLERSFELSSAELHRGGAIYVAVEGTSLRGYLLRAVRYGAEKIINDYVQHYRESVQLYNVALVYSAPGKFRSRVRVIRHPVHFFDTPVKEGEITHLIEHELMPKIPHWPEVSMTEAKLVFDFLYPGASNSPDWYGQFMDFCEKRKQDEELRGRSDEILERIRQEEVIAPEHGPEVNLGYRFALIPFYWAGELLCFLPRQLLYWFISRIDTYIEYEATIKICVAPFLYFFYALLLLAVTGFSLWWFPLVLLILYGLERIRKEIERVRRTKKYRADKIFRYNL
ncbi:MAG TPA: 1-acyl-sn-glycerol-3-phosphate acyltransferase [Saprospiraceae bacterium]|nr:1-acyl-sn-glycerol-3-phosphate acyltransferase [Saprospiraceae bacterium]